MPAAHVPFFPAPDVQETKPPFDMLPEDMRRKIEMRLSGHIISGETVYGSLSASAGFVLDLDSGLRVFAKGSHPQEMSHGTLHIKSEIKVYEYVTVLRDIAPLLYGWVSDDNEDGWTLGLWRYIAPDTAADIHARAADILQLAAQAHGAPVRENLLPAASAHNYISLFLRDEKKWRRIAEEEKIRDKFLALFENPQQGSVWLARNIDSLRVLQTQASAHAFKQGMMHGDLRADNILMSFGRNYIIDWPNACIGPVVFDVLMFSAHLESLGGAATEKLIEAYDKTAGTDFAGPDMSADVFYMAASMAGYFADQAYRMVPEKMPRLRWMQKSLLCALLQLLARHGRIESPPRFAGMNSI